MVVFYVQFRVSSAYAIVQVVRIVEILKQEMKKEMRSNRRLLF